MPGFFFSLVGEGRGIPYKTIPKAVFLVILAYAGSLPWIPAFMGMTIGGLFKYAIPLYFYQISPITRGKPLLSS